MDSGEEVVRPHHFTVKRLSKVQKRSNLVHTLKKLSDKMKDIRLLIFIAPIPSRIKTYTSQRVQKKRTIHVETYKKVIIDLNIVESHGHADRRV